ncbi:MAG: phosphatase PAP2 family protein [Firmicutes bacterium]|nr:phosphatase PAP2 family protein [Bacillota bacterium]
MSVYLLGIKRFEYKVLVRLNSIIAHRVLRGLVLAVTHLGDLVTPFVLAGLFLFNAGTRPVGIMLAAAHFTTYIPVQLIKEAVARPRPYQAYRNISNGGPSLKDYSFPSGHTTSAFTTATVLAHFLPAGAPLFYILAALVGLTRMILGVHYPTDVLIGGIIGTVLPQFLLAFLS